MILADAAQSIYRRDFRWEEIGVALSGGRVHVLRKNYRNTVEILQMADGFLSGHPSLREDGEQVTGSNGVSPRHGPMPALVSCASVRAEADTVADRILQLHNDRGVPFENVAVLTHWRRRMQYFAWALAQRGIPTALLTDADTRLAAPGVKVSTFHSAKGLEFPVVFICDVNQGVLPRVIDGEDGKDEETEA
jgi:superfamily I DNA/RNA helicase